MDDQLRPQEQGAARHAGLPFLQDPLSTGIVASPRPPLQTSATIGERFGKRLRRVRRERGLTQKDMAAFLGIDRSFVSDLENGKVGVSLNYLETIARGFDLSLSELFSDL